MVGGRYTPDVGHVIKIDLEPHLGHEQGGWRPAVVLSPQTYNSRTGLAVVVPVTNQAKGYPFEVPLGGSMKRTGVILADAVRNLDWRQRRAKYVETAVPDVLEAVRIRLGLLLGFPKP